MRLGIFAKTFARPDLGAALDAVTASGLDCIQFNYSCLGLPPMPDAIDPSAVSTAAVEIGRRRISVAAVSGTFNMIDPLLGRRRIGFERLRVLAANCAILDAPIVTLCSGTRDTGDMWRHHPENKRPETWKDLLTAMEQAVKIAEEHEIVLAVEPEIGNVVSSAQKARKLLDEIASPRLKVVLDAANLFQPGDGKRMAEILKEAFDLLGADIALAHAKDFKDGASLSLVAPGKGMLDWQLLLALFRKANFSGPLLLHGLAEAEVKPSIDFLRQQFKKAEPPPPARVSELFHHDDIDFHYQSAGFGAPFFFLHGLGSDLSQAFALFRPPGGIRMIGMDCRAHGDTRPVGPEENLTIATFADDLLALMDYLQIDRAVVGGISMGAAVAMNFAMRHPKRTLGLVMHRPAWLDGPRRDNVAVFMNIAKLLREHGAVEGLAIFKKSETYQRALETSRSTANSLAAQFLHPRAEETVARLERIPLDSPGADRRAWRAIAVPTLIMANDHDAIHPLQFGVTLAREIPAAEFKELTPKSVSEELHQEETQRFLEDFLLDHF